MKFSDGAWLTPPGVKAHHAVEMHSVSRDGDALLVIAPTRRIRHRGDTLQGPLLSLRLDSPLEGVIRVSAEHYAGAARRGPEVSFEGVEAPKVEIKETESAATLRSGSLTARVAKNGDWQLCFERADGSAYTRSGCKGVGYAEVAGDREYMFAQLDLGVGENVYGLGERFTAFVKNGQVVESWNKDGGTGSEQAYKSIPFYLTNRGYGVLVCDNGPVSFEVASERVSRVQFSVPGERLEFLVIAGPTPKEVLERLTRLTGRPALPPAWSFGLWLSTSFTTDYDEATVNSFIDGMSDRDLPLHVFHYDCFWMREFAWCDFQWDPRVFPNPAKQLGQLHGKGLKVSVWINPYVGQASRLFREGADAGYFLRTADGGVWQTDLWQPGMAIVDFTNPAARDWYLGHLRQLLEVGVDCFKTDFGERIPTDVVYFDGSDPERMHNHYSVIYNKAVFELIREVRGDGEAVVFARSSHIGGQKYPVHWGGDCESTYESMAESLRGGLSLGLCGFGFWSHDIGGFEGMPAADIYKRWLAFGLLSSHSRLHGSTSYRVPWLFDDEACDVLKRFTNLKCSLMPYLWSAAREAHEHGTPVMRPMMLEFPDDPACHALDLQYMLGGSLLVAPVLSVDGSTDFYLPDGCWTHLLTGEQRQGGWHRTRHGFLDLPLYARQASVIPFGASQSAVEYDYAEGATFAVTILGDGGSASAAIPALGKTAATSAVARRNGKRITVELDGRIPTTWSVRLLPGDEVHTARDGAKSVGLPVPGSWG